MRYSLFILFLFLFFIQQEVIAITCNEIQAYKNKKYFYEPKPDSNTFYLPMPCGLKMAFKKIIVPGHNFWGDLAKRPDKVMGNFSPEDDKQGIIEKVNQARINGSFYDKKNRYWYYYIGKYEVTRAQVIAVLGFDEYLKVSHRGSFDQALSKVNSKTLIDLSRPVTSLSKLSMQHFIEQYNLWLYNNSKVMPSYNNELGFLRLPNEIEWEYAARGGEKTARSEQYTKKLPWPMTEKNLTKYAQFSINNKKSMKKPQSIGRKKPSILGLYDLIGNVDELMNDPFSIGHQSGRPGSNITKGGNYKQISKKLRTSARRETTPFVFDNKKKGRITTESTLGMRLVISSNLSFNNDKSRIVNDLAEYNNALSRNSPTSKDIEIAVREITNLMSKNKIKNKNLVQQLNKNLTRIRGSLINAHTNLSLKNDELRRIELSKFKTYLQHGQAYAGHFCESIEHINRINKKLYEYKDKDTLKYKRFKKSLNSRKDGKESAAYNIEHGYIKLIKDNIESIINLASYINNPKLGLDINTMINNHYIKYKDYDYGKLITNIYINSVTQAYKKGYFDKNNFIKQAKKQCLLKNI